ncbi:MAG TPA: DUF3341 domain-containing protein [Polyangiaceae bacterium LLY-WYZ-14_1]|jgi:hypothetical protein|nr:DUF3341 domain-containing protein [Polyangiaceae bacterium LLY-WYZ-14_1]
MERQDAQLATAVSQGTKPALYLAEFGTTKDIVHAAEKVRDAGFKKWDVHTPFPVHGMDAAMGLKPTKLGFFSFAGGLTGCLVAAVLIQITNNFQVLPPPFEGYPLIVGGKPPGAIPSMIPVMFELTILLTGFATLFTMLGFNQLPRHHHPVFFSDRFRAATDDRFYISIEAEDPQFDLEKTRTFLESLEPSHLELVEEGDE